MYLEHRLRVLDYGLRRTTAEDAKDLVAEVFLVAWRRLDDVPDEPLPWLLGTARRVLATKRRSKDRQSRLLAKASLERQSGLVAETDGELARALSRLHEHDREILMLVAWDGLKVREAAQVIGCSPATFSVRLHRARQRLATLLEDNPFHGRTNVAMEERR